MAPESRPKYPIALSVTPQRHAKSGFFLVPFLGPKNDNFQKKMAQQMKPKPQEFNPMRWHGLGQLVI
jgi:hypothetical protein